MTFGTIISSPRGCLSLQQILDLSYAYLEIARKAVDPNVALVLCHDTEVSLSQLKKTAKHTEDNTMHGAMAAAFVELGRVLDSRGHGSEAKGFYKKAAKLG